MENDILYPRTVANTLGIPIWLANSIMRRDDFPSEKDGGRLRVTRENFLYWLECEATHLHDADRRGG